MLLCSLALVVGIVLGVCTGLVMTAGDNAVLRAELREVVAENQRLEARIERDASKFVGRDPESGQFVSVEGG